MDSTSCDPLKTAAAYLQNGWRVVPIPARSKGPILDAWQDLRIVESDLPGHFQADSNIGVLNGEPSGWLVDVDLDHQLARELADEFLPATSLEFGRASAPRSHRLFVVTSPVETIQRRLPKVNGKSPMVVELRSTGTQTVFPGSVHPSGESIEWNANGEPERVAPRLLTAAVNALADEIEQRLKPTGSVIFPEPVYAATLPADITERARNYLATIPPAISGQGGHDQTFYAACRLVQGFCLEPAPALDLLREWNQSCEPPWSDRELEHKIAEALKEPGERGYLLNGGDENRLHHATSLSTKSAPPHVEKIIKTRETITAKPFPSHVLPGAVGEFVCEAAAAIGCAVSFVALPMLASLARAVGNKRVIRLKRTWTEPAILWCAIVGKSGTHKSPALAAATAILNRKQADAIEQFQEALQTYERDKALFERDIAQWRRDKKSRSEPPPVAPQEPAIHRYIISDATVEAVANLLQLQPNGDSNLLVVRDELAGWVNGIGEYKGSQNSDVSHWLSTWNAAPLTVDRKTGIKTVHVERAAVSITGGIQPAVLRSSIAREHMQDGLCARLLLAMPEPKPIRWTEATVNPVTEAALEKVFDRLLSLEPAALDGKPVPSAMPLTPEAKTLWVNYYNRHRAELADLDDDLAAAWSKLEAYAARFALIFQLCANAAGEANDDTVDEQSMAAGIELADWFGNEAKRVYDVMVETDADREHRQLVELIQRKGGRITPRELARCTYRYRAPGDAEAALESLTKAGIGRWQVEPTASRPRTVFVLVSDTSDSDRTTEFPDETEDLSLSPMSPSANTHSTNGHDVDAVNQLFDQTAADDEQRNA